MLEDNLKMEDSFFFFLKSLLNLLQLWLCCMFWFFGVRGNPSSPVGD